MARYYKESIFPGSGMPQPASGSVGPPLSSPHDVWGREQRLRQIGGPCSPLPPLVGASLPQVGRQAGREAGQSWEQGAPAGAG